MAGRTAIVKMELLITEVVKKFLEVLAVMGSCSMLCGVVS
jgi:hypothetical protein